MPSSLPATAKRRGRPPGKKREVISTAKAEQQSSVQSFSSAYTDTSNEADRELHAKLYWENAMNRPRTRSTNPYSAAMYVSRKRKEEREQLMQRADYRISDKGIAAEAQAKKDKRTRVKLDRAGEEAGGQHDNGQLEQVEANKVEETEEAQDEEEEKGHSATDNGVIAVLYRQASAADEETQAVDGGIEVAAADSSPSTAGLLRCRCSFLLANTVHRSYESGQWKTGSWYSMRLQTSGGAIHNRIGRIINSLDPPSTVFRSIRVLWYRTAAIEVHTPMPPVGHRRREMRTETKTCAVLDVDQQLAAVSPWEIARLLHPPVRFPCNVDSNHPLPTLPKPEAVADEPLSVQQSDELLTSLCLERLYDQLAGHLHFDEQQQAVCASLSQWHNSLRQLRERHVADALSGYDELAAAVQRCTERLVEAVAYETAASPLASSVSQLALRLACLVWDVLRCCSSAAACGVEAVLGLSVDENGVGTGCGNSHGGAAVGAGSMADAAANGNVV